MVEETTDCMHGNAPELQPPLSTTALAEAMNRLPTLQRNALRKIFDRPDFTPAEVAALGYRRLQQAEGIGQKGLQAITTWLDAYGYQMKPPEPNARPKGVPVKKKRSIEQAVRLLRMHGYAVEAVSKTRDC